MVVYLCFRTVKQSENNVFCHSQTFSLSEKTFQPFSLSLSLLFLLSFFKNDSGNPQQSRTFNKRREMSSPRLSHGTVVQVWPVAEQSSWSLVYSEFKFININHATCPNYTKFNTAVPFVPQQYARQVWSRSDGRFKRYKKDEQTHRQRFLPLIDK